MSPVIMSNDLTSTEPGAGPDLAELRDGGGDTALAAAIARVKDEAADPVAVAAGWQSIT
jgi:FXSXX-COOH protein